MIWIMYLDPYVSLAPREQPVHRQASWSSLMGIMQSAAKVDQMIAEKMGFDGCYPVSGQTYSRKQDTRVLNISCRYCTECP